MKNLIALFAVLLSGAFLCSDAQARVVSKSVVVQRGRANVQVQRIVAAPVFVPHAQLVFPQQQLVIPQQLNYGFGGVQQLNFAPQQLITPSVGVGGGCRSQLFFSR